MSSQPQASLGYDLKLSLLFSSHCAFKTLEDDDVELSMTEASRCQEILFQ